MQKFTVALILALAFSMLDARENLNTYDAPEGLRLKIGALLPSVELKGLDGRAHSTGALKGNPTVVSFFTSHCGPCIKEIPALNEFMDQHPAIHVVAISPDDPESLAYVRKKNGLKWPILANAERALDAWGVLAFPSFVLLNSEGVVVSATYGNRLSNGDGYVSSAGIFKWVNSILPET